MACGAHIRILTKGKAGGFFLKKVKGFLVCVEITNILLPYPGFKQCQIETSCVLMMKMKLIMLRMRMAKTTAKTTTTKTTVTKTKQTKKQ